MHIADQWILLSDGDDIVDVHRQRKETLAHISDFDKRLKVLKLDRWIAHYYKPPYNGYILQIKTAVDKAFREDNMSVAISYYEDYCTDIENFACERKRAILATRRKRTAL